MIKVGIALLATFVIVSLTLPASGFAVFQGPVGFEGKYDAGEDAIQLKWQNVEGYNQQTLSRTGGPSGQPKLLKRQENPPTGQQTFLDANDGQEFVTGAP